MRGVKHVGRFQAELFSGETATFERLPVSRRRSASHDLGAGEGDLVDVCHHRGRGSYRQRTEVVGLVEEPLALTATDYVRRRRK